jgi:isopenicillin-N N-acyltransferase-like protein
MAGMFPLLELSGDPFGRGRAYGRAARDRIGLSIETYRRLFAHCGLGWDEVQALAARFVGPIRDLDPALWEEIEGIASGCGYRTAEILALNWRTEILPPSFPDPPEGAWLAAVRRGADPGECTAIAIQPPRSATGDTLLAQNWDWLGAQRDALVLVRARTARTTYLTLTEAGMLAKIGLNRQGLGVCLNILRSREDGLAAGVPVHVLLRRLLECASVAEAQALVSRLRYGASSNIVCADAAGAAASFELSPAGTAVVRAEGGMLCHTNHFLDAGLAAIQAAPAESLSSEPRLERARAIAGSRAKLGVEDVQALLRDESDGYLSICRRPDPRLPWHLRIESVASVVMELGRRVMHVAAGVPSRCEYAETGLDPQAVLP